MNDIQFFGVYEAVTYGRNWWMTDWYKFKLPFQAVFGDSDYWQWNSCLNSYFEKTNSHLKQCASNSNGKSEWYLGEVSGGD